MQVTLARGKVFILTCITLENFYMPYENTLAKSWKLSWNNGKINDIEMRNEIWSQIDMVGDLRLRLIVDISALVTLIISFFSGVIIWIILPRARTIFLGIFRHGWIDIHVYSSLAFLFFVLIHHILTFKQLITMVKRFLKLERV